MTLYIIGSPYQLINAIMIRRRCREDASVLYVMNFSAHAPKYYLAAKKSGVFDEVRLIDVGYYETKNKVRYVANRCIKTLLPGKMIADDNSYDAVFANGADIYSKAACHYFYKKSGGRVHIHLLEDGIGTYGRILKKDRSLRLSVTKAMLGYDYFETCSEVYAYRPELISSDYALDYKKIPCLDEEDKKLLLYCFLGDAPAPIAEKIIFLEGAFAQAEIERMQDNALQAMADWGMDIALKSHPLYLGKSLPGVHELDGSTPFELFCMNQPMDGKVMLSVCSTAAFTPKLMLDQEPVIVFLYQMLPEFSGLFSQYERMIIKFEEIYDKSKIFKPKSLTELRKVLEDVRK